ncbi:LysR family transcriptional regulator [Pseudomonas sp. CCC3.2]|uniref:LysR family transcriptional regulator n=1 Tax=unclassified Pseudomonas TaxID=196821 RepID=UPI002AB5AFC7|nr:MULTISPECIES: LysR family transcriptional regulator [unclassified Pseudomonas]MDY7560100.1 LysR family transcriptional regulator [Pseudomonas sp. AB6]MEA9975732.1 LysR family transcriptional regulator [Pseudomonas sp. RTS4]MEB0180050.1 LysR family transcriptional regulator [Pseudomonas sp. CCC3.2]MEB0197521.1 LysR family transcriptional regulator [Pseudomonas sp. 5S4]MEB0211211.1 LysR family transcriptional regulator [Pseudomonas sp. AB6]
MDRFNAMRVFTRIVELGGFAKAADSLHIPRASATILVKQLEAHLGVQLLQRTTRQVKPTLDGEAYYQRCTSLLTDLEDTEAIFASNQVEPKGTLRIDIPVGFGRLIILPALPKFTARYPQLELEIGMSDRPVKLIREGVDCVVRIGPSLDDSLVARLLAHIPQITCASREYLARVGMPKSLEDLQGHQVIEYFSANSGKRYGLEFQLGSEVHEVSLPRALSINSADGYLAACEAGYGLMQTPHYHIVEQLRSGALLEVLGAYRPPTMALMALYPPHQQMSRRVRVFIDWLVELCAQHNLSNKKHSSQ